MIRRFVQQRKAVRAATAARTAADAQAIAPPRASTTPHTVRANDTAGNAAPDRTGAAGCPVCHGTCSCPIRKAVELRLADIPLRQDVELVRIDLPDHELEPLLERGILPGCRLCPVRRSPSGDPILLVDGLLVAVRREMAGCLCVKHTEPDAA